VTPEAKSPPEVVSQSQPEVFRQNLSWILKIMMTLKQQNLSEEHSRVRTNFIYLAKFRKAEETSYKTVIP
jgi:catabolite regulation protein CreA